MCHRASFQDEFILFSFPLSFFIQNHFWKLKLNIIFCGMTSNLDSSSDNFNVEMKKNKTTKPVFWRTMSVGFEISFIKSGLQYLEQFLCQTLPPTQQNIIVSLELIFNFLQTKIFYLYFLILVAVIVSQSQACIKC